MEHLALEIFDRTGTGSKYAVLPDNTTITITETNEIFASGDVWSHAFTLNIHTNAHIFGTAGDLHGSRLHEQINKRRARLWIEGTPYYLGYLLLDDEADVDKEGNVDVKFESGQKSFDQLIEGATANQVPLWSDVQIGYALKRKRKNTVLYRLQLSIITNQGRKKTTIKNDAGYEDIGFYLDGDKEPIQEYPRMVFSNHRVKRISDGAWLHESFINTDSPYTEDEDGTPTHPYCNIALCYQRYGYEKKNALGKYENDYTSEPEAQRDYEYMPADRVNSAPNFFVLYWLRCLMKKLDIYIEENQLMEIEDFRRLFFVNTNCEYEERNDFKYEFSRHGYDLLAEQFQPDDGIFTETEKCEFEADDVSLNYTPYYKWQSWSQSYKELIKPRKYEINITRVGQSSTADTQYRNDNNKLETAYASKNCFPKVSISDVISALENGFGVRFLFSNDMQRVRIVLLRNVLRNTEIQKVDCDVIEDDVKIENNKRGFRMTYGNTEDTAYYYKGFADKLPHKKTTWPDESDKHDYSNWELNAQYVDVIKKVAAFNKTCYVTPVNGNAYGVKVDKDANHYDEMHQALFEFAGFMDAEDGDCTGEEETIETVNLGFNPAIMNDLNIQSEDNSNKEQRFALFVDKEMQPRRVQDYYYKNSGQYDTDRMITESKAKKNGVVQPGKFEVATRVNAKSTNLNASCKWNITINDYYDVEWNGADSIDCDINLNIKALVYDAYRLYLQDNFKPNDDGIAPIELKDWGLTLGIMRGSGSSSQVEYSDQYPDGEGNDTWWITPGSEAISHPDTCDSFGKEWDYNGTGGGIGDRDGRISLKLRAEKPDPRFNSAENDPNSWRYLSITNENLRGRGLCDQFYKEYSYWIRNARIVKRTVRMEWSRLQSIDKKKRAKVGDITGLIRKTQYSINKQTGLGNVTFEIMYI